MLRSMPMAKGLDGLAAGMALGLLVGAAAVRAQETAMPAYGVPSMDMGVKPGFVAVHGRRSVVMGYAGEGLEVWAYPFEVLSGYQASFRQKGAATATDGRSLLRGIEYRPESITRTYIGPDYLVRETLFVPLDKPAAVVRYEVEGSRDVDIDVRFEPVLNLMWPGAAGGQYTRWLGDGSGYEIAEPEHGVSAVVGSGEIVAHDDTVNSTVGAASKAFTVRPRAGAGGSREAEVYVVLQEGGEAQNKAGYGALEGQLREEEQQAAAHYAALGRGALQLRTPDEEVNRAVEWAEIALDQAWVCNLKIGCGLIAGYGPSRAARRPQYDWFFAGDGLIATNALVSAGEYARAKEELEFIEKYQQPETGMIWHEISQSAGYIDWSKYPYMYVHVDITFDYLATVARYVSTSGDTRYAGEHWASIAKAYAYCRSLIRDSDHLPHIPADKEGGDEQARPGDDLGLSAGWLAASAGFAELARVTGHTAAAGEASAQNELTRRAIPAAYWDAKADYWIDGHTQGGAAIPGRRRGPSQLLEQHVFAGEQEEAVLEALASADFEADWGLREVAASAPDYDPDSYGRGSITAPSTAYTAMTFWKEHRPAIGNEIWEELIPWNTLDSPGHIHEVLAGNFYHEQAESVPEQTWSSAGLLDAAVRGLLGLEVDGVENRVELRPHVPAQWGEVSIGNVQLPGGKVDLTLAQDMGGVSLEIDNSGMSTKVLFAPELPLGAKLVSATYGGRKIAAKVESYPEEQEAKIALEAPAGRSRCEVRWEGGVSLSVPAAALHPGDGSTAVKLVRVRWREHVLAIDADVNPKGSATVELRTPWKLGRQQGASAEPVGGGTYRVRLLPGVGQASRAGYTRVHAEITLVP